MSMESKLFDLLQKYLSEKDDRYLDELLEKGQNIINNAIKKTLRHNGISEDKMEEYLAPVYIKLITKLRDLDFYEGDEKAFYSLISNAVVGEVQCEIDREKRRNDKIAPIDYSFDLSREDALKKSWKV